jgi:hypothetical protein
MVRLDPPMLQMGNEAGHKYQIDCTVTEDLIGDVDITALGIPDRRLHRILSCRRGAVDPDSEQVMRVAWEFSAPMPQDNRRKYFGPNSRTLMLGIKGTNCA